MLIKYVLLSLLMLSFYSFSGVKPIHTREVMGTKDEHQINIINTSNESYLVQTWLEDLDGNSKGLPLILTPPIFALEGEERGFVRILPIPKKLPQDRESVYYLLVQEIPQETKTDDSILKIAVRSKIKVFLRPDSISAEGLEKSASQIQWELVVKEGKNYLRATNDSPYYFSFGQLKISNNKDALFLDDRFIMSSPFDKQDYRIPDGFDINDFTLEFGIINDYGGINKTYTRKF